MGSPLDGESTYRFFWISIFIIFYAFNIYHFYEQKNVNNNEVCFITTDIKIHHLHEHDSSKFFLQSSISASCVSVPHSKIGVFQYFILVFGSLWQTMGRIMTKRFTLLCRCLKQHGKGMHSRLAPESRFWTTRLRFLNHLAIQNLSK